MTPFFVLFFDILPRLPPNVRFGGAKSETNRVGRAFCPPVNVLRSGANAYLARRKAKLRQPPLRELLFVGFRPLPSHDLYMRVCTNRRKP